MKIKKKIKVVIVVNGKHCDWRCFAFFTEPGDQRCLLYRIPLGFDYKKERDLRCQACLDEFGHTGEDK